MSGEYEANPRPLGLVTELSSDVLNAPSQAGEYVIHKQPGQISADPSPTMEAEGDTSQAKEAESVHDFNKNQVLDITSDIIIHDVSREHQHDSIEKTHTIESLPVAKETENKDRPNQPRFRYIDATNDIVMHAVLHLYFLKLLNTMNCIRKWRLKFEPREAYSSSPNQSSGTKSIGMQTFPNLQRCRNYGRVSRCIKRVLKDRTFTQRPSGTSSCVKTTKAQSGTALEKDATKHCCHHPSDWNYVRTSTPFPNTFEKCTAFFEYVHDDQCNIIKSLRPIPKDRSPCETVTTTTTPMKRVHSAPVGLYTGEIHTPVTIASSESDTSLDHSGIPHQIRYTTKAHTCPNTALANKWSASLSKTCESEHRNDDDLNFFVPLSRKKKHRDKTSNNSSKSDDVIDDEHLESSPAPNSTSNSSNQNATSCDDDNSNESSSNSSDSSDCGTSSSSDCTSSSSESCNSDESDLKFTWDELLEIPGCVPEPGYIVYGHVLGEGVYGKVYSGTMVKGLQLVPVAVKVFKSNNKIEDIQMEVDALTALSGSGTAPHLYGVTRKCEHRFGLVLELIGQGITLHDYLVKISNKTEVDKDTWLTIIYALTSALYKIHALDVRINDIKTDNVILVSASEARYVDMGFATKGYDMTMGSCSGDYLAPEVREGGAGSKAADVFSLGHIFDIVADECECEDIRQWAAMCMKDNAKERPSTVDLLGMIGETLNTYRLSQCQLGPVEVVTV